MRSGIDNTVKALRPERAEFRSDLIAGLTFSVVNVPQAMAHALLAAVNPMLGIYIIAVTVNDRTVVVTVDGYGELRPLKELANTLALTLKRPVVVNLRVEPSQIESSE